MKTSCFSEPCCSEPRKPLPPRGSASACWRHVGCAFLALALAALAGCAPEQACTELSSCGGDLEGTWINEASCLDDQYRGQPPGSIRGQPTTPAGQVPPEPSSTDWCSGLVFDNDGTIRRFVPWRPLLPIQRATLEYTRGDAPFAEGRYDFAVVYYGRPEFDLSERCLTQHGTRLSCAQLGPALEDNQQVDADLTNFQCVELVRGGCRCSFDVESYGGSSGVWDSAGDVVHHFSDNRTPLSRETYCVRGDTLELTGDSLGYLFNQAGVRTMRFRRQ